MQLVVVRRRTIVTLTASSVTEMDCCIQI